jgi:hypothetical protein
MLLNCSFTFSFLEGTFFTQIILLFPIFIYSKYSNRGHIIKKNGAIKKTEQKKYLIEFFKKKLVYLLKVGVLYSGDYPTTKASLASS